MNNKAVVDTQEKVNAAPPESKDNKWLAILYMNIFVVAHKGQKIIFKHIAKEDVSVIEFCFFRNCLILLVSFIYFAYKKKNPFGNFPKTASFRIDVMIRSLAGQLTFALENYSFTMLPMATALIMVATNPFWVIVLSLCMFRDKILPIEILGILVCLAGVGILAYSEHFEAEKEFEEKKEKNEV